MQGSEQDSSAAMHGEGKQRNRNIVAIQPERYGPTNSQRTGQIDKGYGKGKQMTEITGESKREGKKGTGGSHDQPMMENRPQCWGPKEKDNQRKSKGETNREGVYTPEAKEKESAAQHGETQYQGHDRTHQHVKHGKKGGDNSGKGERKRGGKVDPQSNKEDWMLHKIVELQARIRRQKQQIYDTDRSLNWWMGNAGKSNKGQEPSAWNAPGPAQPQHSPRKRYWDDESSADLATQRRWADSGEDKHGGEKEPYQSSIPAKAPHGKQTENSMGIEQPASQAMCAWARTSNQTDTSHHPDEQQGNEPSPAQQQSNTAPTKEKYI